MKIRTLSLGLSAILLAGLAARPAAAVEVLGKKLEIYAKANISLDASDNDRSGGNLQNDLSLSSNSSRVGFKGVLPAGSGMEAVYQVEQEVGFDSGSGNFATRNTFVGLQGGFGRIIFGHHDTPFKTAAAKWGLFGDTVGDRRKILGASALHGNKLNNRAKNAVMYTNGIGDLRFDLMYSPDGKDSAKGAIDNNNKAMYSFDAVYQTGPVKLAAAYVKWDDLSSTFGSVKGWRAYARYHFGRFMVGGIYEDVNVDSATKDPSLDRSAWGLNGSVALPGDLSLRAEYLRADDYAGVANSGANAYTLGLFGKFNKTVHWYAAYTTTRNDANAQYQGVDGGHGDEVKTDLGRNPTSFSLGLVVKL